MFKQKNPNKQQMSSVAPQEGTNPHLCSVSGAAGSFGLCLAQLNFTVCSLAGEEITFGYLAVLSLT